MRRITGRMFTKACWIVCVLAAPSLATAQTMTVPLTADQWTATDSLREETYLGRPSLYINRGVAIARNAALENGTIEYDVAASAATTFLGVAFHAVSPRFSEVVNFRMAWSGTAEAIQYGPAFNGVAIAWQLYHGDGANAVATLPRERWVHVKIELDGATGRMYFDTATSPTLVIPQLAAAGGKGLGIFAGAFGRGAYFSNIRYTPSSKTSSAAAGAVAAPGTITKWELSNIVEPTDFSPAKLPDQKTLTWQRISAEPPGFVLINRYRVGPNVGVPVNPKTHELLLDSLMTGKVAGSKIVYARTTIDSDRDEVRRMHFGYSDGVVIYANGKPLMFAMNPDQLRGDDLAASTIAVAGDAVYLPLKRGRNEIVLAVIELGGGWGFWARLDP